jgi:adenine-specific DNA-methyltransferase
MYTINNVLADNLVIQGDNRLVMINLINEPNKLENKIDMLLWDPPYNTGRNDFIYNDNRPEWIAFMRERLILGRNLLKESGVIAIHIGYQELFRLGLLMDEVFGEENRLGIVNWECTYGPKNIRRGISSTTDYILIYAKNKELAYRGVLPRTKSMNDRYKNPDNDPRGPWLADNLTVGMNASMRPNQAYNLVDPQTGKIYRFNPSRVWTFIPSTMDQMIREGRIIFPKDTRQRPKLKRYLSELKHEGRNIGTYWKSEEFFDANEPTSISLSHELSENNGDAKRLLKAVLGNNCTFDTPKPLKLTERLIEMFCPKEGIVLDAFGGSATTAHAVLDLNNKSANRKFILIEQTEFAESITAERIRRVINGNWAYPTKETKPLGGDFILIKERLCH